MTSQPNQPDPIGEILINFAHAVRHQTGKAPYDDTPLNEAKAALSTLLVRERLDELKDLRALAAQHGDMAWGIEFDMRITRLEKQVNKEAK
jgi:hypothetical protein